MSPRPLTERPALVSRGHGQQGYVLVRCELRAETRESLVAIAQRENRTLKSVLNEALERYLAEKA